MSERPAEIVGLPDQGRPIAIGEPANLTVVDPDATYFGTPVTERSLVTADDAERGTPRLSHWLGAR